MIQNIFIGFMLVIAIGAGIFGWWMDNGSTRETTPGEEVVAQKKDTDKDN